MDTDCLKDLKYDRISTIMASKKNLLEGLAQQGRLPVDDVPAQLTENEYVIPADVVIALGRGDVQAGVEFLDGLVEKVRSQTQGALSGMMGR